MIASFVQHTLITLALTLVLVTVFWKVVSVTVPFSRFIKRLLIHMFIYFMSWIPSIVSSFPLMKHKGSWTVIFNGEFSAQQTFFSLLIFYTGVLLPQLFNLMWTFEAWRDAAEMDEEEREEAEA